MILRKLMPSFVFFVTLIAVPLFARHHHHESHESQQVIEQSYGKLSASPTIDNLVIENPQLFVPQPTGWQPFPVNISSTSLKTILDPSTATITVKNSGTYLINALLTLEYPEPGYNGPDDLTNYCIGIICNGELQLDSIGSFHISTEAGHENPGLLFSCSLSDLVTLPANSTIQFVISASSGADDSYMEVTSANATVVQVGN